MEGRIPARRALGPAAPGPYHRRTMRRVPRRHLVPIVCLAVAGLIGVAAIVDHRWKQSRINHAELLEWYCQHRGTRCGGPSSESIEAHWNQRELGYEIAVVALGGLAVALVVFRTVRR